MADNPTNRRRLAGAIDAALQPVSQELVSLTASTKIVLQLNLDPCPCGSGKLIRDCCLRPCGSLIPKGPRTGFAHPACYARGTNDCSQKITGEHYISKSVLEISEEFGGLNILGLPWQKTGATHKPRPENLTAKVLCERHNGALSPLDAFAARLFRAFFDMNEAGSINMYLFSGHDLERWIIKAVCGGVCSGNLRGPGGGRVDWVPGGDLINSLFGGSVLHPPCGLYSCSQPGDPHEGNRLALASIINDSTVVGGIVHFHGFQFLLAMAPPDPVGGGLLDNAHFRLSEINIAVRGMVKHFFFDWGGHNGGAIHAIQLRDPRLPQLNPATR